MSVDVLITQYVSRGAGRLAGELNMIAGAFGRVESAQEKAMRRSMGIASAGAAGLLVLGKIAQESLRKAGDVQATRAGFATLLGSQQKARDLYAQIENFSLKSPLNNAETAKGAQLLLSTGTAADKIIPRLKALSNANSSAGGGQDRFNGLLMAMAAISNSTYASRQQIKRLEIRGVQANKILQRELGLTGDQVANLGKQHIKGAVVAEALYRGMAKIGGGMADDNLNKTLGGQLSQLEDQTDQLKAKFGELILPDATAFVRQMSTAVAHVRDLVKYHPRASKAAFVGAGVASVGAVAYGGIRTIQMATLARKALEKAVKSDSAAELAKTGIAGREAKAIAGTGSAAADTTQKLGLLARTGAFLRNPLTIRGTSVATSAAFGGGRGALGALGGLGAQGGARSMGLVTTGGALVSGALGVAAGVQAAGNMKAAGYSDGQSYMYAAATGIGAAGAAMFLPGGAVAVALGMAAAAGINKFYNEPLERKAALGSGADNTDVMGEGMQARLMAAQKAGDRKALAQIYDEMSKKSEAAGDTTSAQSYALQAQSQRNIRDKENTRGTPEHNARMEREAAPYLKAARERAARETTPEAIAQWRQQQQAAATQMIESGTAPTGQDEQGNLIYNRPALSPVNQAKNTQTRNHDGSTVVRVVQEFRIEESRGDRHARDARYMTMTPYNG